MTENEKNVTENPNVEVTNELKVETPKTEKKKYGAEEYVKPEPPKDFDWNALGKKSGYLFKRRQEKVRRNL